MGIVLLEAIDYNMRFDCGEVLEWTIRRAWRARVAFGYRGFESHPLRQIVSCVTIFFLTISICYSHLIASASLFSIACLAMPPMFAACIIPAWSIKKLVGMTVTL